MPNKPAPAAAPKSHHLDRVADLIIATPGDDDDLLSTQALADYLRVSTQWCEIARHRGYGPPYIRIGLKTIRYQRGEVRKWLTERARDDVQA